jgi:hypothetical protein
MYLFKTCENYQYVGTSIIKLYVYMLTYKDFSLLQNTQNSSGSLQASSSVGTAYKAARI